MYAAPHDPAPHADPLERGLVALGYAGFRPGQREAIETLLEVGKLLLVAPTGGGKSLVYQLPATLLGGTTLVISPLIALMHDQVRALEERGIAATFLASTLDGDETRRRMARIAAGGLALVYVSPERLVLPGFRALARDLAPPLVAIDEAHCISEWGHDFRPEYGQIGELLAELASTRVLACTATATPIVRDEILAKLGLDAATPQLVQGFARPNLAFGVVEVESRREREREVDRQLGEALGAPRGSTGRSSGTAIVYSPTRRGAEEEAVRLAARGWRARYYHAGLAPADRDAIHQSFAAGELEIVVATNAFGMGIDRPDVRAVIHLGPPGSIEAYYQEVGRAGRDGAPAYGLLTVMPGDVPMRRRLLERPSEEGVADPAVLAHKWNLFLELMRWAQGGSCRHDAILRYFGDEAETLDGCGRCDVCRALANGATESSSEEITLVVRKALSGVARIHGRFGLNAAAKLLRGVPDPRLANAGLDRTTTFGVLKERSELWLMALLRRCMVAGWVDLSGGERPVALLTDDGRAVMKAERPARLLLPAEGRPRAAASSGSSGTHARGDGKRAAADEAELDAESLKLFESLRAWRLAVARNERVPPYVVASDRTLRDLARIKPRALHDLELAHGIGPAKVERYGRDLLAQILIALERP
ncbi:MAG: ATP-dependent DNA helicase RecQ [bacterium]